MPILSISHRAIRTRQQRLSKLAVRGPLGLVTCKKTFLLSLFSILFPVCVFASPVNVALNKPASTNVSTSWIVNGGIDPALAVDGNLNASGAIGQQFTAGFVVEPFLEVDLQSDFQIGHINLRSFNTVAIRAFSWPLRVVVFDDSAQVYDSGPTSVNIHNYNRDFTVNAVGDRVRVTGVRGTDPFFPEGFLHINELQVFATANNAPPTAEANGDYVLSGSALSLDFDSSGTADPDNNISSYSWQIPGGSTLSGASPEVSLVDAGFTSPGDADKTVTLTVTDSDGDFDTDTATLSYEEVAPEVQAGATLSAAGGMLTLSGTVLDPDLLANDEVPGFESGTFALWYDGNELAGLGGDWGAVNGDIADLAATWQAADIVSALGGPGFYDLTLRVTDAAGAFDEITFTEVAIGAVPAPASALLLIPGAAYLLRRR